MDGVAPAHSVTGGTALSVITIAGVLSAIVFGISAAAFLRRRSVAYLLLTIAFGLLFARSAVGFASFTGMILDGTHHLLEHAIDALVAAVVIAAVYYARQAEQRAANYPETAGYDDGPGEP